MTGALAIVAAGRCAVGADQCGIMFSFFIVGAIGVSVLSGSFLLLVVLFLAHGDGACLAPADDVDIDVEGPGPGRCFSGDAAAF